MAGVTSIGKPTGEGVVSLGTEAWNIADGYTKIKILRIIIQLDLHEELACFGKKDQEEQVPEKEIPYRKVEGLKRMIFYLKQLIGNCRFSIDDKFDKLLVDKFMKRIKNVENYFEGVAHECSNQITKEKELIIDEEHFQRCFEILREIKDELNFPINRAGLIFRQSDELDLDKMMTEIIEGG